MLALRRLHQALPPSPHCAREAFVRNLVGRGPVTAAHPVRTGTTSNSSLRAVPTTTGAACRTFSSYSSLSEPEPTLFHHGAAPISGNSGGANASPLGSLNDQDLDAQLRADIRVMGSLLGQVIQTYEGPEIFKKVEAMRGLAKTWRENGAGRAGGQQQQAADAAFAELAEYAGKLSNEELFTVARAFTHFLAIANSAEGHHRGRRLAASAAEKQAGALYPKPDSVGGVLPDLLEQGHSADDIYDALIQQCTELVLTAHPTEVNRRTLLAKKERIQKILNNADKFRLSGASAFDKIQLDLAMQREIASIWQSDEVSRIKPTPEVEAEKNTLVLETVLWKAVPNYLRRLNMTCQTYLNKSLPLDAAPIRFASWMGGDRDGNPNVVPTTTRHVVLANRETAARLFAQDLDDLYQALSLTLCSAELRSKLDGERREPYRAYLAPILAKMERTQQWAQQELDHLHHVKKSPGADVVETDEIYLDNDEFKEDLMVMYRSLHETENAVAADGLLTDVLRNVSAFGLALIPLDVRQESDRHEEAVDCITRYLGLGRYAEWDEASKINWLSTQIASRRPLIRKGVWHDHPDVFSEAAVDTLETFAMIAEQPGDSLGAYVISQATEASDVLAVLLLQLDAGVKKPLRVAPLFETLDDLNGADKTMKALFNLPTYMGIINGRQEVMIGYSDSAKDAGRLAASWAQYETQEKLAQLARTKGVNMTFFHGKGGTVGRGGNPQTFKAIMSHAPETINGQFRVTEQGEMINQNFGYGDRAERTMDIYTAAVLADRLTKRPTPTQEWRSVMKELSDVSCDAYRRVVRGDDRFVPYFRSATPEQEFANLNIGSRPSKRKPTGGVESLRAIPWNFAWTQTRFNLPTWLGVSEALGAFLKDDSKAATLRKLYADFGAFRTMVDLVEMVLTKSEPAIAAHYDSKLVKDRKAQELGKEMRKLHLETELFVMDLAGHSKLGENNKLLERLLGVRNPYVDCLNVLQAETLSRIRASEEAENDKILKDALLTTITGVANGMGNTG